MGSVERVALPVLPGEHDVLDRVDLALGAAQDPVIELGGWPPWTVITCRSPARSVDHMTHNSSSQGPDLVPGGVGVPHRLDRHRPSDVGGLLVLL